MKVLDKYLWNILDYIYYGICNLFFIFVLQTIWFIYCEFLGKDLDFFMIKFLLFSMPKELYLLLLPLSILLLL
jgi:hypothetical protein